MAWSPADMGAAGPNAILDGWFLAQTNVRTWQAEFIQTRALRALSQPLVATGKVWVALPDQFRWELGEPAQTIALRQPDQLFLIYPQLKRAEKYPLNEKQSGPWRDALALLEASFPRSREELQSRFRVQSVIQTNATFLIALQPQSAAARRMMKAIQVGLSTNDFSLRSTELTLSDGSSLRNDFTNAVLNSELPEHCFDAKLEPEVAVVEPLRQ
jgi:outer membrane lipoprotein-sorting protein